MLSICLNELKKLKRQKTARMLWAVGILIPTFGTLLCIKNHYPFRNLVGTNVLFGSFLVIPFVFSAMLLNLFELEERNHTLKNILVIGVPEWKIFIQIGRCSCDCCGIYGNYYCLYSCRRNFSAELYFGCFPYFRYTFNNISVQRLCDNACGAFDYFAPQKEPDCDDSD